MVVDQGWQSEDELSQGYEDWMDFQHTEEAERDPKITKTIGDQVVPSHIYASTRTKLVLKQKSCCPEQQDEVDLLLYKSKNLAAHTSGKDDVSDSISVNGGGDFWEY